MEWNQLITLLYILLQVLSVFYGVSEAEELNDVTSTKYRILPQIISQERELQHVVEERIAQQLSAGSTLFDCLNNSTLHLPSELYNDTIIIGCTVGDMRVSASSVIFVECLFTGQVFTEYVYQFSYLFLHSNFTGGGSASISITEYSDSEAVLVGCRIEECSSLSILGSYGGGTVGLIDCLVKNSSTENDLGMEFMSNLFILNSTFVSNSGPLIRFGYDLTIVNSYFSNNELQLSPSTSLISSSPNTYSQERYVTIVGTTFESNQGTCLILDSCTVNVTDSTFISNQVADYSGTISLQECNTYVGGSTFIQLLGGGSNGAAIAMSGKTYIENSSFQYIAPMYDIIGSDESSSIFLNVDLKRVLIDDFATVLMSQVQFGQGGILTIGASNVSLSSCQLPTTTISVTLGELYCDLCTLTLSQLTAEKAFLQISDSKVHNTSCTSTSSSLQILDSGLNFFNLSSLTGTTNFLLTGSNLTTSYINFLGGSQSLLLQNSNLINLTLTVVSENKLQLQATNTSLSGARLSLAGNVVLQNSILNHSFVTFGSGNLTFMESAVVRTNLTSLSTGMMWIAQSTINQSLLYISSTHTVVTASTFLYLEDLAPFTLYQTAQLHVSSSSFCSSFPGIQCESSEVEVMGDLVSSYLTGCSTFTFQPPILSELFAGNLCGQLVFLVPFNGTNAGFQVNVSLSSPSAPVELTLFLQGNSTQTNINTETIPAGEEIFTATVPPSGTAIPSLGDYLLQINVTETFPTPIPVTLLLSYSPPSLSYQNSLFQPVVGFIFTVNSSMAVQYDLRDSWALSFIPDSPGIPVTLNGDIITNISGSSNGVLLFPKPDAGWVGLYDFFLGGSVTGLKARVIYVSPYAFALTISLIITVSVAAITFRVVRRIILEKRKVAQEFENAHIELTWRKEGINAMIQEAMKKQNATTCSEWLSETDLSFPKGLRFQQEILNNCQSIVDSQLVHRSQSQTYNMTKEDLLTLCLYTYDVAPLKALYQGTNKEYLVNDLSQKDNFYFILNNALKSKDPEELQPWIPYLQLFMNALRKLPNHQSITYRGCPGRDVIKDKYPVNQPVEWFAFTSTSTELQTAVNFAGSDGVIFRIQLNEGKDISELSCIKREKEILLTPNMKFSVTQAIHEEEVPVNPTTIKRLHFIDMTHLPDGFLFF